MSIGADFLFCLLNARVSLITYKMQIAGQKLKNPSRMLVSKLGKSMKNNQNEKVIQ